MHFLSSCSSFVSSSTIVSTSGAGARTVMIFFLHVIAKESPACRILHEWLTWNEVTQALPSPPTPKEVADKLTYIPVIPKTPTKASEVVSGHGVSSKKHVTRAIAITPTIRKHLQARGLKSLKNLSKTENFLFLWRKGNYCGNGRPVNER